MKKLPITVVMITRDEEHHIREAVSSALSWCSELFVVDSYSTDGTVDAALSEGAKVIQRSFRSFGDQWRFALERLPIETTWTMKLDPDERVPPQLVEEMEKELASPSADAYYIKLRLWFMGRPLHVTLKQLRLWRTGACTFEGADVNERAVTSGRIGELKSPAEHLDSPDLHHWLAKQNLYTSLEAISMLEGMKLPAKPRLVGSPLERRMWFKKTFWKIPGRHTLWFLYNFLLRGAWRDGRLGLDWARTRVMVMRLRELKYREAILRGKPPHIPPLIEKVHPKVAKSQLQTYVTGKGDVES